MKNSKKLERGIVITEQTILYSIMTALDETPEKIVIPETEYDEFIDDIQSYVIDNYNYYYEDYTPNYIGLVNDFAKLYKYIE